MHFPQDMQRTLANAGLLSIYVTGLSATALGFSINLISDSTVEMFYTDMEGKHFLD